jgi:hypothetical protein
MLLVSSHLGRGRSKKQEGKNNTVGSVKISNHRVVVQSVTSGTLITNILYLRRL